MSDAQKFTFQLADNLDIVRILNGMWQVSGAHGAIKPAAALKAMRAYHDAGLTTWDLADHYGPAEDLIGQFRRQLIANDDEAALAQMLAFTKWVPRPESMSRAKVEAAIDVSRRRMQMDTLDMVQFHWWVYRHPAYLDAMRHMADLQAEGKIKHLALTNFDTNHMAKIVDAKITLVSNQVQYSLIDQRPQVQMAEYCQQNGIGLLAYGTVMGGLLTDRYLDQPEPHPAHLTTASLRKYKHMLDAWGDWALFQRLLRALRSIADKYNVNIATVALRWVLEQPAVAGVIVGARLGISEHRQDNLQAFTFALNANDYAQINAITAEANDLFALIGDCGAEYR